MGQSLNWNRYFKVGIFYYKVWQALSQSWAASHYYKGTQKLLQSGASNYKADSRFFKVGRFIIKWDRYYKVGQLLEGRTVHKPKLNQRFGQKTQLSS